MQRFTARLVLLLVALSTCEPFLQALSGTPPHACCLRRLHARDHGRLQLRDSTSRSNNCCPPLTTPRSGTVIAHDAATVQLQASGFDPELLSCFPPAGSSSDHSVRGPPDSPNA